MRNPAPDKTLCIRFKRNLSNRSDALWFSPKLRDGSVKQFRLPGSFCLVNVVVLCSRVGIPLFLSSQ